MCLDPPAAVVVGLEMALGTSTNLGRSTSLLVERKQTGKRC